ncbi:MAG: YbhB/YbcL family Raf kinase inhibitor-like protein [Proteobacteria bacterium]|nr:YbhB/YbcL family Raf kinase inhibitor-like protein [Pseudomonadota bacterium]
MRLDTPESRTLDLFFSLGVAIGVAIVYIAFHVMAATPDKEFRVLSPDFVEGVALDDRLTHSDFGCWGANRSPLLSWSGAPLGTKSYAVTLFDPDAPTGSGWWHWQVIDIPGDAKGLLATSPGVKSALWPASAREMRNDFGAAAYGGPCPPQGDHPHRYLFTVFAVNEVLGVKEDTPAAQLLRLIDQAEVLKPVAGHICTEYKLWELSYPHNMSGHKPRGGEWVNQPGVWEGSAEMLEDFLCGHKDGWGSSVARSAMRLMGKGSLPAMLARLREDQPERVDKRDRANMRGWAIAAPAGTELPTGAGGGKNSGESDAVQGPIDTAD